MCGRFSIFADPERLAERFDASLPEQGLQPRYNAAPTQDLPVILNEDERHIQLLRWGLVPFWAEDPAIGSRMINARSETLAEKPSFRTALKKRRCLVLADGFYEWQKTADGKVPMRITLKTGEPFAMAGLWETWKEPTGDLLRTFTIITTSPNDLLEPIHNRMPVILPKETWNLWLDPAAQVGEVQPLLVPLPADRMAAHPVGKAVGNTRNDGPDLILPLT